MARIPDKIGKYKIDSLLGRGGMGEVYKAHDAALGRFVALKIMRGPSLDDTNARERFIREAQAAGGLRHPNIVTVYELGDVEEQMYIAMEFIHGQDLEHLIKAKAPITIEEKFNIMIQVCEGMSYAHKHQIVHRDLKPSNIRIDEEGIVKIMDFGIAKLESSSMTASGMVLGTPYYMSPEQVRGIRVDTRSDLFALGAILYETFAYAKAFMGEMATVFYKIVNEQPEPLSSYLNVPAEPLQRVVNRCLEKDKNARVQTAGEIAQLLREAQSTYRKLNADTMCGVETVNLSPTTIPLNVSSAPAAVDTTGGRRISSQHPPSPAPTPRPSYASLNNVPATELIQRVPEATPTQLPGTKVEMSRSQVAPPEYAAPSESVPYAVPAGRPHEGMSPSKLLLTATLILLLFTACGFGVYHFIIKSGEDVTDTTKRDIPPSENTKKPAEIVQKGEVVATTQELSQGKALYQGGNYEDAMRAYENLLQKYPNDANLHFLMGAAKQKLVRNQEALLEYQRAVELNPQMDKAWQQIGFILTDRMDYKRAEQAFQRAISIDPKAGASWEGLAQTYFSMQDQQKAEDAYKKLLEIEKDNFHALYNLGQIEQRKNNLDAAKDYYQKAIDVNPNLAEAHNNLGNVLLQTGHIDESIVENEKALQLKPRFPQAHWNLFAAYEQKNDFKRAAEHLRQYMEMTGDESPELKKKLEEYSR